MKKIRKVISLIKERSLLTPLIIMTSIFLFVSGFSFMILDRQYVSIEALFEEASIGYINQTEEVVKTWLDTKVKVAGIIAEDVRIIATCEDPENIGKREEAKEYLNSMNGVYAEIELITIVTTREIPFLIKTITPSGSHLDTIVKKGEAFISSKDDTIVGKIGLKYSYVSEVIEGKKLYISDAYLSIYDNNPIIVISAPVENDKKIVGVAVISVKLEDFTDGFISDARVASTGYMFIIDDRKMTVAHPEKERILVGNAYESDIQQSIDKIVSGETFFRGKYKNEKRIYTSKRTRISPYLNTDWYIVSSINVKDLFSEMSSLKVLLILMSLFVFVISTSMIVMIFRINGESTYRKALEETNENLEEKIIERRQVLEEKVKRDSLTDLYNHNTFFRLLEEEFKNSINSEARLSLIMLDIDRFKNVNDDYGHIAGDEVLIKLASVLRKHIRNRDVVGRYGGEEFIILLKDTTYSDAIKKAEEIRGLIESTEFSIEDLKVTASFGVATWDGVQSVAEIAKSVDDKLYKAKRTGRNKVVYED